jgi:hypothetical protein
MRLTLRPRGTLAGGPEAQLFEEPRTVHRDLASGPTHEVPHMVGFRTESIR